MGSLIEVEAKVDSHIDVCAVRYEGNAEQMRGINARLKRIEQKTKNEAGEVIMFLLGLVFKGLIQ